MRPVIYEDKDGYLRRSLIKDDDPDMMADCGIPAGPPDVRQIDMDALLRVINNLLVENELFDWDDVQKSAIGIQPALTMFKRAIISLYRQEKINNKNN